MDLMLGGSSLSNLPFLRDYESKRASSWDQTGGNEDWWVLQSGEAKTLLTEDLPGCIKHIWMTVGNNDLFPRQLVIRFWWDGQEHPSIECPLGDFFGLGHGLFKNWSSLPLQMLPEDGRSMNCWWAMPFSTCVVEVENQGEVPVNLYFYIDYETWPDAPGLDVGRFHAFWRRENPTEGWMTEKLTPETYLDVWRSKPNLSDKDNYLILEAEGSGIYVGCHLNVDAFQRVGNDWYGEGDDMIVIDGEPWPPRLHGTGTEDYFCTAFGPTQEFCGPYAGLHHTTQGPDGWHWQGKQSMYRWHIEDPIRFKKSIKVSIEHGEANALSLDMSSVAYWYQTLPSKPLPHLLPMKLRMPRPDEKVEEES